MHSLKAEILDDMGDTLAHKAEATSTPEDIISAEYVQVLEQPMVIALCNNTKPNHLLYIFQQHGLIVIESRCSPDLSPIANIWCIMKI